MKDKKKKKKEDKPLEKRVKKDTENSKPEEFDFGGIPDRDLKKNLGCG